jgi:cyclopropane fatty-acyl-phospholipid synthase-like methyltransferase
VAEFYDLAELALNRDGQSWGNLGYWQSATDYSDACRALATLLGEQAGLDHKSIVFDAGFGCGDQLLLWLEHFGVSQIYGVNLSHSQTAHAGNLLARNGRPVSAEAILEGDVNDPGIWTAALNGARPSHVMALDCAYHFPDRLAFWELAQRNLAPAGRLALTDFMLAEHHRTDGFRHRLLRWMLKRAHITETNIVHRDVYLDQLEKEGFGNISVVDISEHVMPAFTSGDGKGLRWSAWCKYAVTSRFLKWAYHRSVLRYCVVSATKADQSDNRN